MIQTCFQSCLGIYGVSLNIDSTGLVVEDVCCLNSVHNSGTVQSLTVWWAMVKENKSNLHHMTQTPLIIYFQTASKAIIKLTTKTFHSMQDKDWIAPSLSSVLPCYWTLASASLSRMDRPVHWDPLESDFLLHKL